MKKLSILVLLFIAIIGLSSCEGDQGEPGINILGSTAEFTVDFNNSNEFYYEFADDGIEVFESDAVLVYRSEEYIDDSSGPIDVWKQMPQTVYFDNGDQLVYNFDHTFFDVRIFLDGDIDLNTISTEYYQNQLFRVVVVPSDFANDPNNNLETYSDLLNEINQQGYQIEQIN
ncbi:hypothetical protein SAMN04488096_106135 [Mesonia phycicola]|uniref:Collagen-like protein n=1 Tax=Mesonia phycicola TaxID=579105 RepID=A0A1M6FGM4_9FLAO|nr:hypothetical protein [Mesonia phycicola]SHI96891.1 hypothetical protein SAMN04488096_106135 [Mesonia phycicola]